MGQHGKQKVSVQADIQLRPWGSFPGLHLIALALADPADGHSVGPWNQCSRLCWPHMDFQSQEILECEAQKHLALTGWRASPPGTANDNHIAVQGGDGDSASGMEAGLPLTGPGAFKLTLPEPPSNLYSSLQCEVKAREVRACAKSHSQKVLALDCHTFSSAPLCAQHMTLSWVISLSPSHPSSGCLS
jgi:hypothetical protein